MEENQVRELHPAVATIVLLVCGFGLFVALPDVVSDMQFYTPRVRMPVAMGGIAIAGMLAVLFAARRMRVFLFLLAGGQLLLYLLFEKIIVATYYWPR